MFFTTDKPFQKFLSGFTYLLGRALEIILLEVSVILLCCTFTTIPWKVLRLILDFQYGRPDYKIRLPYVHHSFDHHYYHHDDNHASDTSDHQTVITAQNVGTWPEIDKEQQQQTGVAATTNENTWRNWSHYLSKVKLMACVTWPLLENWLEMWRETELITQNGCRYLLATTTTTAATTKHYDCDRRNNTARTDRTTNNHYYAVNSSWHDSSRNDDDHGHDTNESVDRPHSTNKSTTIILAAQLASVDIRKVNRSRFHHQSQHQQQKQPLELTNNQRAPSPPPWTTILEPTTKNAAPPTNAINLANYSQQQLTTRTIFFVHGGALISGSPLKHNSYNWITTIAYHSGYTHLLLPRYSLAPEAKSPHPLIDLLCVLYEHFCEEESQDRSVTILSFVGFSAGCYLLLQVYLLLVHWSCESCNNDCCSARNRCGDVDASSIFGVSKTTFRTICQCYTEQRTDRILAALHTMHLCAGLYRTENLYLNERFDVSPILKEYIRVYTNDPLRDDPLLTTTLMRYELHHLPKHLARLRATDAELTRTCLIRLFDVNVNSLSNHSIQLHAILPNGTKLHIFDASYFNVNEWLLRHGNVSHKFLQNLTSVTSSLTTTNYYNNYNDDDYDYDDDDDEDDSETWLPRGRADNNSKQQRKKEDGDTVNSAYLSAGSVKVHKIINAMHYHFFPFIACSDAGRITITTIIHDLQSI